MRHSEAPATATSSLPSPMIRPTLASVRLPVRLLHLLSPAARRRRLWPGHRRSPLASPHAPASTRVACVTSTYEHWSAIALPVSLRMQWGCGAQQLTLRAALLHSSQPRLLWVPLCDGVSPKHPRQQRPDLHAARRLEERHQLVGVVVVACSSCKLPSSNEEVYTTTSNKDMHYDANFPVTQWAFLYCRRTFKATSCMPASEQWTL